MKNRVVITGMGIISPVGNTIPQAWDSIIHGRSGIKRISSIDTSGLSVHIAGEIVDFDATTYISAKEARRQDRFIQMGLAAGIQAIDDAGLSKNESDSHRIGVAIGSGIGGLPIIEETKLALVKNGARKVSPFFVPSTIINMVSGNLSIMYGFQGPNIAIVTACSTGTHCIGHSARMIAYGDADVMIAGGAESTISPLCVAGFAAARALSSQFNDQPELASRPWDKARDGFVLGEGAGVLVLESLNHAQARGAHIYGELAGYGLTSDAYHITQPAEDGNGAIRAMNMAIADANATPQQIGYINAHGTSTPLGDLAESMAVRKTLGAAADQVVMSSTKSMTGHLLGAAGGIEAIFTTLALHHQLAPPTINLNEVDDGCDLDYCAHEARDLKIEAALSNSFGFGGTNATLVMRKWSG